MTQSYPLHWPEGWSRVSAPRNSRFRMTFDRARRLLAAEVDRLGGDGLILSTNLPLRRDGWPYASARPPEDKGAAAYFSFNDRQVVFACDQYRLVEDNIYAIALTIEALRGIERWGASGMLERAFTGFAALAPADGVAHATYEEPT